MLVFDLIKAVCVRVVLLIHSLLVIWLASSITHQRLNWILAVANIGLLAESFVTLIKNKGQEWKWFCPCFFFYLCSTIPGIWILELDRMQGYQDKQDAVNQINTDTSKHNATNTTDARKSHPFDDIQGVTIPITMETETLVIIMEQLFLYLMILARWILPRGEITRNELSQLLFVFIGIASDITELFALFEEHAVRMSTNLTYVILCIWSFSLLQFTFVLTSTHSPKKTRTALATVSAPDDEANDVKENVIKAFFQTEVWSICVNFLLQDGPFLAVRLYTMIEFKVLTYSIIFFTAKNGLLVMLLVYRLSVLCIERQSKVGATEEEASSIGSKKALSEDSKAKSVEFIEKIDESNKDIPAVTDARKRNGNNERQNEP
ncbi:transmembrane protein 26-like [Mercenaria mercenaria]|uniref:transmembrane protein 26-like n=1 Tax=Mercenaria mercenaria TaxID=6596 RepID=UPI00234F6F23|nr:transmembrane protein 26-like [Mercenaria mercenaria]